MNTTTLLLRGATIAWLAAAAAGAFAQAPACTSSPAPDCLYVPAASYGFTSFARNVAYTDNAGSQRVVELLIRQPLGAPLPMPVVVWSHGGAGKTNPATSMAEWSDLSARAGYVSISIAHGQRDATSRTALCQSIGIDAAACALFGHLKWDRPHDIRAVLDEVDRMAVTDFRGQIDKARIAVGGHSAGSGGVQTVAGATRNFGSPGNPPWRLSDPRPIAFLSFSPQQPGVAGFFDTRFQKPAHSWTDVQPPMLIATGDGGCEPTGTPGECIGDTPFGRRIGYQRMPATGNKYQLYVHDADAFHMLFELNAKQCPPKNVDAAKCAEIVRWLSSTALAFLDGHVRQLPAALQWLQSNRIEQASGGVAEWQRK